MVNSTPENAAPAAPTREDHDAIPAFRYRSVTAWLIGINVAIFVLDALLKHRLYQWGAFTRESAAMHLQVWRWVTYQFLHAHLLHLGLNMLGLYIFGPVMEKWWGGRRFLGFYLLCGMSGAWLFSVLAYLNVISAGVGQPLIGASGSVYGILMGCALVAGDVQVLLLFPPMPIKVRTLVIVAVLIALASILLKWRNAGSEAAHLGGALLGFFLVKRAGAADKSG
ncbi:MAG: rhomboid family intramembrane serine protease [Phycisphaeraceae bacterium]